MKYSIDYELVKNDEKWKLFLKYKGLIINAYNKIGKYYMDDFDDFLGWSYEIFIRAFNSIKLEKIKNPANWSFYIVFYQYIGTYTKQELSKKSKIPELSLNHHILESEHGKYSEAEEFIIDRRYEHLEIPIELEKPYKILSTCTSAMEFRQKLVDNGYKRREIYDIINNFKRIIATNKYTGDKTNE